MAGLKGASGRPPKPVEQHILDGTYRKHRHEELMKQAPESATGGQLPDPPEDLPDDVYLAWTELSKHVRSRIYTEDDVLAFRAFAQMWANWKDACEDMRVKGKYSEYNGRETLASHTKLYLELNGRLLHYFARFGLTPADRSRVAVIKDSDGPEENADDEFGSH